MTKMVRVPFGENASDKATLLLAAAEAEGLDASVVSTNSHGVEMGFVVPESVAKAALSGDDLKAVEAHEPVTADNTYTVQAAQTTETAQAEAEAKIGEQPAKKSAAKKAPAKKAAAKKSAAKKSTAKKAAAKKSTSGKA